MSGSGASDDASSRLTDSDVEEEMEAMQQKELFKYMTSSVEEQKAIESLESLQKSAGWGKEVRSLWPWIVGVMARFCSNERVQILGCDVLRRCAWLCEEQDRWEMASGAASRIIAAAMSRFPERADVQLSAVRAVAALARRNQKAERVLVDNLLASVLSSLRRFNEISGIRLESSRVIRNVCESGDGVIMQRLAKMGAAQVLVQTLTADKIAAETMLNICATLLAFINAMGYRVLVDTSAGKQALLAAEDMGQRNESFAAARCCKIAATALTESDVQFAIYLAINLLNTFTDMPYITEACFELLNAVAQVWPAGQSIPETDLIGQSESCADVAPGQKDDEQRQRALIIIILKRLLAGLSDPATRIAGCKVLISTIVGWKASVWAKFETSLIAIIARVLHKSDEQDDTTSINAAINLLDVFASAFPEETLAMEDVSEQSNLNEAGERELSSYRGRQALIDSLLAVMNARPRKLEIQLFGFNAIYSITTNWSSQVWMRRHKEVGEHISRVLEQHHHDDGIAQAGCKSLWALCGTTGGLHFIAKKTAAPTVIASLVVESRDREEVLATALLATSRLAYDRNARSTLLKAKIDEHAESALQVYPNKLDVVKASMSALEHLLTGEESVRVKFESESGMETISKLMDKWNKSEPVISAAFGILRVMTMHGRNLGMCLGNLDLESRIIEGLQNFALSVSTQTRGFQAIANLAHKDTKMTESLLAAGVVQYIINSVSTWPADENLVQAALCAINSLALNGMGNADSLRDDAIFDFIHDSFIRFADHDRIVILCTRTICSLSKLGDDVREAFNQLGCSRNVLQSMELFSGNVDVQIDGCVALGVLDWGEESCENGVEDCLRPVMAAMEKFLLNPTLQSSGLNAVLNLVRLSEKNAREFADLGYMGLILRLSARIFSIKSAHEGNASVQNLALSIEELMQDFDTASISSNETDTTLAQTSRVRLAAQSLKNFSHHGTEKLPRRNTATYLRSVLERAGILTAKPQSSMSVNMFPSSQADDEVYRSTVDATASREESDC